jgi:hypothetical protein
MRAEGARAGGIPVIVRVSGLPAHVVVALRGDRAMAAVARLDELDAQMAALREETAARIFTILPETDPENRRHLLNLKRDCFNGRSLRNHRHAARWASLRASLGDDLGDRLAATEDELIAAREQFRAHYVADRDRAREHLRALTRHAELIRGVTLASPALADYLGRLHARDVNQYQRREHKVAHSLLRYVTRAAVKLSPYSTLTKVGLGVLGGDDGDGVAVRFLDGERCERSLLRVKSYLLDQCCRLLFLNPAVRDQLVVCLNDTVEEIGDAHYRFLRPMVLEADPKTGELRHALPSIVQVRLRGALIDWLRESLASPCMTHAAARQAAVEHFEAERDEIEATLVKLLSIGFLRLIPPWPSYEPHLEPRLLRFLRSIDARGGLDEVIATLAHLVAIEDGFSRAADPLRTVRELDRTVSLLFERIKAATRPDSELRFEKEEQNYYEDVVVYARDRAPTREVLHMDRATADELSHTSELLWRLGYLYEPEHEFRHALYHFMRERWPERDRVPFLEMFAAIQPLWEKYLAHLAVPANRGQLFDPFSLDAVAALGRLREDVYRAFHALHVEDDHRLRIPIDELRALAARIPERYRSPVSACLFVQPADAEGQSWVVNRFFESTGRYSSRYTAVLPLDMRAVVVDHLERRGRLTVDGEDTELLDMLFTRSNTVNLHWPQTPKVLELPGEHADLGDARCRRLRDLHVAIDHERRHCVLRDGRGQRYIPCFLSPQQPEFLPSLLKMLNVFSVMARWGLQIARTPHVHDGVMAYPRLSLGRLVILRQRWVIPLDRLPVRGQLEHEDFLAVQRWRRLHAIPTQCYLIEPVTADYTKRTVYKPQYIDFRSPELVTLLLASLATAKEPITLEEALPVPDAFPFDGSGVRRGVEIILESLSLAS